MWTLDPTISRDLMQSLRPHWRRPAADVDCVGPGIDWIHGGPGIDECTNGETVISCNIV